MEITKDNTKLSILIAKYYTTIKNGEDTGTLKAQIDAFTQEYIEQNNNNLNRMRQEVKESKQVIQSDNLIVEKTSVRKEYKKLIELYRKAIDISKDISKFKKQLRGVK